MINEQKFLTQQAAMPQDLAEAVIEQFGDWDSFTESAEDVTNHGINGGFGGFIYYTDTIPFAEKHRDGIATMAQEQAESFGMGTLEMIQGFVCLGSDYSLDEIGKCLYGEGEDTQILNAFAWYAGEELCRAYCDMKEWDDEEDED